MILGRELLASLLLQQAPILQQAPRTSRVPTRKFSRQRQKALPLAGEGFLRLGDSPVYQQAPRRGEKMRMAVSGVIRA